MKLSIMTYFLSSGIELGIAAEDFYEANKQDFQRLEKNLLWACKHDSRDHGSRYKEALERELTKLQEEGPVPLGKIRSLKWLKLPPPLGYMSDLKHLILGISHLHKTKIQRQGITYAINPDAEEPDPYPLELSYPVVISKSSRDGRSSYSFQHIERYRLSFRYVANSTAPQPGNCVLFSIETRQGIDTGKSYSLPYDDRIISYS